MKEFDGKAILNPSGKAGEYSYWACNFYKGCSNECSYCYLKKGVLSKALGGNTPVLKACFVDEEDALRVFEKEMRQNKTELQKHGLFFSFTTDPMLPETINLTLLAVGLCLTNDIPVKILTKNAAFLDYNLFQVHAMQLLSSDWKEKIAIGMTLTGCDELEPKASSNEMRINAFNRLKLAGFGTFASIEPVIDFDNSLEMIERTLLHCDHYKIGLMSGKKYDKKDVRAFIVGVNAMVKNHIHYYKVNPKIYWKDGILKAADMERETLPEFCVNRYFNLFTYKTKENAVC